MDHGGYLIKSAVNRARQLLSLGKLSDQAIKALRRGGYLPTATRMGRGLDQGTFNIMKKEQIGGVFPEEYTRAGIPGGLRTIVPHMAYWPPDAPAPALGQFGDVSKTVKFVSSLLRYVPGVNIPFSKKVEPKDYRAFAAAIRRHEIDEAVLSKRMGRNSFLRWLSARERLDPNDPRFSSHVSPEVIRRESRYVPGLRPVVGPFMKALRTKIDTLAPGDYGYYGTIAPRPKLPLRPLKESITQQMFGAAEAGLYHDKDKKFWASRGYDAGNQGKGI